VINYRPSIQPFNNKLISFKLGINLQISLSNDIQLIRIFTRLEYIHIGLKVLMLKTIQYPMKQMLVHVFLLAVRNFANAVLKKLLHWVLVFVNMPAHESLVTWKIVAEVHESLAVDVSHDVVVPGDDGGCSFTIINAGDSSEMIA
jgi:hypothetical protein